MEFAEEFEYDFMKRTLSLMQSYRGPFDATLLLNCLVGLLIVPRETAFDRIPLDPISSLSTWGLSPGAIITVGRPRYKGHQPATLRGVVHSLRNSVAHFRVRPLHENRQVIAFRFTDANGFDAIIPIDEMREFVEKLSTHLLENRDIEQ